MEVAFELRAQNEEFLCERARGIPSPVAQEGGERAGEPMGNAGSVAQVQIWSQGVVRREAQMAPSQGTWSSASGE